MLPISNHLPGFGFPLELLKQFPIALTIGR